METLSGIVQRITFSSEETGWTVLKVAPFNRPQDIVTVTIHQAQIFAGATVEFNGSWTEHSQYGQQFKATHFLEKKPASTAALEKYLGSGLIYGIGPKTAKKIVKHFKKDTLTIFEEDIERLKEISGIAQAKLEKISFAWTEHREIRNVMMFLQSHGISTLFAVKIYKQYGNEAINIVQDDPYQLSKNIFGIGFLSADKIAASLGIAEQDPRRIKAAIKHILAGSREEGHCYLTFAQICKGINDLLECSLDEFAQKYLDEMITDHEIKLRKIKEGECEQHCYYSKTLFYNEKYVGEKVSLFLEKDPAVDLERMNDWLESFNKGQEFPLSEQQSSSVMGVLGKRFSILTGGPGCGKTTTTKAIVKLAMAMGKKVLLAAPTGRASQRMEEVIGLPAKTIHRLLIWTPANGGFKKGEEDLLDADFIVLDECSMLDISLTASLLKAIDHQHTQLLFIGDKDQLPSVGAGNVLKDLIESEKVPVFKLTQVFRQAQGSLIIRYAHQINMGEVPKIDTPFRKPELWKSGVDAMFIDSEEVTMEGLKFINRAKKVFKNQLDTEGEGVLQVEDKKGEQYKKVSKIDEQYMSQDMLQGEFDELKEGKFENKVFTIPKKFRHVQIENLLSSSSEIAELKEILTKVHPFSTLNFGIKASDMILKLYKDIIPKYLGKDVEIQVLSPMVRGSMGTMTLNQKIQNEFNIYAADKKQLIIGEKIFRCGDRVIQKRNNYNLEVFNGDIGKITEIDLLTQEIMVRYPEKKGLIVTYKKENLMELDLAYAITIHKSQGSEFSAVIIPVATQHFKMLFRNLIYTGLTRAKKCIIFVGTRKALAMAVHNMDNRQRQTYLSQLISNPKVL